MDYQEVMRELEAAGSEQTRKTYRRHGIGSNQFGVLTSAQEKLRKKIKVDQQLAEQLWASGNYDARYLALLIADPAQSGQRLLERWSKDLDNYAIADALAGFVAKTPLAQKQMEKWTKAKTEWLGQTGWVLLAHLAMKDNSLDDAYFTAYLDIIERDLHKSKNRVRHAMNSALIAIGIRNDKLKKRAVAVAKKIGKVEVDHGQTNCKTPDAIAYIEKARARKR